MNTYKCHYCGEEYSNFKEDSYKDLAYRVGLCDDCEEKLLEKYNELESMNDGDIIEYFRSKFKNLETYEDLKEFLFYFKRCGNKPEMEIRSKRSSNSPYHFTQNHYDEEKVDYLYDDGFSTGSGKIRNLYKYLEIRVWGRRDKSE